VVFGNPETTTGGNALKFYSTIRLDVRKTTQIKQGDEVRGHRVKVKVVKNKMAPPFRITEFDLIYGQGVSQMGILLDYAVNAEIIQKSGTWFSYGKERLGQGRDNCIKYLEENPEFAADLDQQLRRLHKLIPEDTEEGTDASAATESAE